MLNAEHVKNDVKWRPIVTKFGTLIENMSRTRLHDHHIFQILFDEFMRNSNFGIGVLHVKVKYWRIFVSSFLYSLKFLLFHRIVYPSRCLWKKYWNFSMAQFLWYDCAFKKQCTVPVILTFILWRLLFFSELSTSLLVSCINFRSISLLIAEK